MRSRRLTGLVPLIVVALVGVSASGASAEAVPAAGHPGYAVSAADGSALAGGGYTPLNGSGSSWAAPAIDQWARDMRPSGIVVNFDPLGSAAGRQNYISDQADFAASDIAFLTIPDPFQGGTERSPWAYSYIPIVAGGTSFLYNLVVGGRKITNLRLSGGTITKIFTGQITNWDNKQITHDYGAQLPNIPITVVVRSDGSGASYQFTRWMSRQYTSQWDSFCARSGGPRRNCGPTEFYPSNALPDGKPLNGSDLVANYIASRSNVGAIGYDEYAYALNNNIPVVKVLNPAGYYVKPTASNVAIALQKARIDENPRDLTFLMQNLDQVYRYRDPRSYPLSSYSYLIVPRDRRVINGQTYGPPHIFNTSKGRTLTTWLRYVLCGAQQTAGSLGYSPLPKNLVVGGFLQFSHIPGHIGTPNLRQLNNCNNPTYHNGVNYLIKNAPYPSKCDYKTAPLNCTTGRGSSGGGGGGSGSGRSGSGSGTSGSGSSGSGTTNPNTGQVTNVPGATTTGQVNAQPVSANGTPPQEEWVFIALAVAALLGAIAVPTLLGSWLERRGRRT